MLKKILSSTIIKLVLAVIAGIADQTQYDEIFNLLKSQKHASPYMEKYIMEALFIMGQSNYALERVQSRFAPMVDNKEYSTLFEGWDIGEKGFGGGTVNHAWSGGGFSGGSFGGGMGGGGGAGSRF